MSELYSANTAARFWGLQAEIQPQRWEAAAIEAASLLPGGAAALARGGWSGLMEHILGEGQFGPERYTLSTPKRLYYRLRPIVPRPAMLAIRRRYQRNPLDRFPLGWPIEDRYVRFLARVRDQVAEGRPPARGAPGPTVGGSSDSFWPDRSDYAFALTHDVETADGQAFVRRVADLDERYGFRSSFNFVPEGYRADQRLLDELKMRGFEIGVHGLKHDGQLFSSRTEFERRSRRINNYLSEWGSVGFRSPFTHRNPEWMQALDIEYDSSCFDTDPYETMPGGTMSIWPFFCGKYVELPYTLIQDHTLLVVLKQRTPQMWIDKIDFIARCGGLALVNVHPDYMRNPAHFSVYEEFLREMAKRRTRPSRAAGSGSMQGGPAFWHAVPREVSRWWRARSRMVEMGQRSSETVRLANLNA